MNKQKEKKRVTFIVQDRSETGKTMLTYLCAIKYEDAKIVDVDREHKTITQYAAYRSPIELSFIDSTGFPSYELYRKFFASIKLLPETHFICDFGSQESEFLPDLLREDLQYGNSVLDLLDIDLHILVVVAGHYLFPACMNYLDCLTKAADRKIKITAFRNEFYTYNEKLNRQLETYCQQHGIKQGTLVELGASNSDIIVDNYN